MRTQAPVWTRVSSLLLIPFALAAGVFAQAGDGSPFVRNLTAPAATEAPLVLAGQGQGGFARLGGLDNVTQAQGFPFGPNFAGGIRVAMGDVTGDGLSDYVTGSGPGGGAIRIYSGDSVLNVGTLYPFGESFSAGIFVATADVTGDGVSDVIAGSGSGAMVRVYRGPDLGDVIQGPVFAGTGYGGGVHVAAGDIDGDGKAEVLVGQASGGRVRLFDGATFIPFIDVSPYGPLPGGISVAMGDFSGDGLADVAIAPAGGPGPVRLFRMSDGVELPGGWPFGTAYRGGIRLALGDYDGDGRADIVVAPGAGYPPLVRIFSSADQHLIADLPAFDAGYTGGVYVAAPQFARARFTSEDRATFRVGEAGSFTVAAAGAPPVTSLTLAGTLPAGVTFTDHGDGTAGLDGTPDAATGGSYPLTITAVNGAFTTTQAFTLTVEQPVAITSGSATTFPLGVPGSFTVETTGFPHPALSVTGALPAGVTFSDHGDGTATLSGTPDPASGGVYPLNISASNGVGAPAAQTFTLTVDASPAFTSVAGATFEIGVSGSFTVTTTAVPAVDTIAIAGVLPMGISYSDHGDGTATFSGIPGAGTAGLHTVTLTATNSGGTPAVQSFEIIVHEPPLIATADAATFTVGSADTFTIATTGNPQASIALTGTLPAGVTFQDVADGTALLAGTPAIGSGGSYALTVTASNGVGTPATQAFTLTVREAPSITSAATATFTAGAPASFTVTTTGTPLASIAQSGTLPGGLSFVDNGNGTATLSGIPAAGSGGSYAIGFTATNTAGVSPAQAFTLLVDDAPAITSAATTTMTVGAASPFTITTTGHPLPAITYTGTLPAGLTFVDNGDGTATIGGTADPGTGGTHALTLNATNGIGTAATQSFSLVVDETPAITSAATTSFTVGTAGSFTVTTTGTPAPSLAQGGVSLPAGVSFVDNGNGTGTLSGTPLSGAGGSHAITFTATNASGSSPAQAFTLIVNAAPLFSSSNATTFTVGTAGSFTATTTGYPAPAISQTFGTVSGVTLTDNGNGTATLAGTPAAGSGGTHALQFTATNSSGFLNHPFTLTVNEAPQVTSAATITLVAGQSGSFTVTTTGYPAAAIARGGVSLPSGLSFVDNSNGTGTLSGTPAAGSGGDYAITFTATNTAGSSAVQAVTLTVQQPPAFTSTNSASFTVGTPVSFAVAASGGPAPTISRSASPLPAGVTYTAGTSTFGGTATETGAFPMTFTAANGVPPDATQSFTLNIICPTITVNPATLPNGLYNASYGPVTFTQTGSTGSSFTWSATGLPAGLSIGTSSGQVTGTPTNTTFDTDVTITVQDNFGCQGVRNTTIAVLPNPDNEVFSNAVGNTQLVLGGPAPATPHVFVSGSVLDGDQGPGTLQATVAAGPANGTLTLQPNGTFVYTPNAGFAGPSDAFTYVLVDGNNVENTANVTINIAERVWFVNNTYTGVNGTSDGRSHRPFTTMGQADTASGANDIVFVHTGSGTTPGFITLDAGQQLRGQGTAFSVRGLSLPAAGKPTLGGTVNIGGANVTVSALDISTGAAAGFSAVGRNNLKVENGVSVTTTGGFGVALRDLTGGTIAFQDVAVGNGGNAVSVARVDASTISFRSVSSNGGLEGLSLDEVNLTSGSFTVTGAGSPGSGGTIQNASRRGADLLGSKNVSLNWMTFTGNGTTDAIAAATCGEAYSGSNQNCAAGIHMAASSDITLNRVSVSGGVQIGINGNNVTNLAMTNVNVTGAGTDNLEDGVQFVNLLGTVTMTDVNFTGNYHRQLEVQNSSGTLNLTVTRGTFDHQTYDSTGGQGVLFAGHGTATMTGTVRDSDFKHNFGTAFTGQSVDSANVTLTIGDAAVPANGNRFVDNSLALQFLSDNSSTMNATAGYNSITLTPTTPVTSGATPVTFRKGTGATGLYTARFIRNTIGNGAPGSGTNCAGCNGVSITNEGLSGNMYVTVTDNLIQNVSQRGVEAQMQAVDTVGVVIANNTFQSPDGVPGSRIGHAVFAASASDDFEPGSLCADIQGNNISGQWDAITTGNIRVRQRFVGAFRLRGIGGTTAAAAVTYLDGNNVNALSSATADGVFTMGPTACVP